MCCRIKYHQLFVTSPGLLLAVSNKWLHLTGFLTSVGEVGVVRIGTTSA